MNCQSCGSTALVEFLDLGDQPICNAVLTAEELKQPEKTYPLRVYVCPKCFLVQIADVAPREEVFGKNYNYLSGSSPALVAYFKVFSQRMIEKFNLTSEDTVLDIGSNDGTFLGFFKEKIVNVYGVEPTPKPAEIANQHGIPTLDAYFDEVDLASDVKYGEKPRLITALNVIAHVKDIHAFLGNVASMMDNHSVFVSQSHYLPALIEKLEYDTIYHEHLRYYTLNTLRFLFEAHNLFIYNVEFTDIYGGSIIVYATKYPTERLINITSEAKFNDLRTYFDFAEQVRMNRNKLVAFLSILKMQKKKIIGVGAPMKASTLLSFLNLPDGTLDFITELNPLKIGCYTPKTHIQIVNELFQWNRTDIDYALILSWNFTPEIIQRMRQHGYTGGFIVPIPMFYTINELVNVTDERGTITDVLTDAQIEHVNEITFAKDAIRGNHYHKQSVHWDYVLGGELMVYTKFPWEETKKRLARKGDLIFTSPNERHALKALVPSRIMVFTRGPRGGKNYEIDTYRLEGADKLI